MTAILGISAFYHDSAAALVIDGEVTGQEMGTSLILANWTSDNP